MSDVERGLLGSDPSGDEAAAGVGNRDDVSSSPELECIGCGVSSKVECPIAKRRKRDQQDGAQGFVRVQWGKTTKRKVRSSKGSVKRLVRRCGEWCQLCYNIGRQKMKWGGT
eukprot:6826284-Lingulodinium_polyedra.AAC.1